MVAVLLAAAQFPTKPCDRMVREEALRPKPIAGRQTIERLKHDGCLKAAGIGP